MTFKLLLDIGFWALIIVCGSVLIWELISGGQKKFWQYQRSRRKEKRAPVSKYVGSCENGRL